MVSVSVLTAVMSCDSVLGALPCPPDLNCSGQVNVEDLLGVIGAWGDPSGPADINGSGAVNVEDLLLVIGAWGQCVFDFGSRYPNAEAHQIGLEMLGSAGSLTLSQAMYDRIERDLGMIRTAHPGLASQGHTLEWAPNQLIVSVPIGIPGPDYQCLNSYYQVIDEDFLFDIGNLDYYVITFAGKVNVERLAAIYTDSPDVNSAEPNGLVGGQNFYRPSLLINTNWRWDIDDGFHDCFDGCDCHRHYIVDTTTAGQVINVLYEEYGLPWCDFGTTK